QGRRLARPRARRPVHRGGPPGDHRLPGRLRGGAEPPHGPGRLGDGARVPGLLGEDIEVSGTLHVAPSRERTVFAPIERLTVRRPYEPRSSGSRDQLRPRRPPRPGAGGRLLYPALRSRPGGAAALREDRLRTTEGDAPRR